MEFLFFIGYYILLIVLNYGVEGIFFYYILCVNINVEMIKKNGIFVVKEIKGFKKWGSIKYCEENKIGEKRDEMIDGE